MFIFLHLAAECARPLSILLRIGRETQFTKIQYNRKNPTEESGRGDDDEPVSSLCFPYLVREPHHHVQNDEGDERHMHEHEGE